MECHISILSEGGKLHDYDVSLYLYIAHKDITTPESASPQGHFFA